MKGSISSGDIEQLLHRLEAAGRSEEFFRSCCHELAGRLLALTIKKTPVKTGNLRRQWTGGKDTDGRRYGDSLEVRREGNSYYITVTNPAEYASYVEYGHRTKNHQGWVNGTLMLTRSEIELAELTPGILEQKLKKMLKEVFNG